MFLYIGEFPLLSLLSDNFSLPPWHLHYLERLVGKVWRQPPVNKIQFGMFFGDPSLGHGDTTFLTVPTPVAWWGYARLRSNKLNSLQYINPSLLSTYYQNVVWAIMESKALPCVPVFWTILWFISWVLPALSWFSCAPRPYSQASPKTPLLPVHHPTTISS